MTREEICELCQNTVNAFFEEFQRRPDEDETAMLASAVYDFVMLHYDRPTYH